MLSYITRRILLIFPILLLVLTVVFLGVRIVPGNPALVILGIEPLLSHWRRLRSNSV